VRAIKIIILLIANVMSLISCQSMKHENISFEEFINNVSSSQVSQRHEIVNDYLSSIETSPIIEGKEKVHFFWYGKADTVMINGDLQNGWSKPQYLNKLVCGMYSFFYISYSLPSNSLVQYQLFVDAEVVMDLMNPRVVKHLSYGNRNVLQMPEFVHSKALSYRTDVKEGRVEHSLFSSNNPEFTDRLLEIYLPYNYDKEKRYPILFVNDGRFKLYSTPFKIILDNLIHDQLIEPIIVVFVPFVERWKEYCSKSLAFAEVIAKEMVPFVSENYSTIESAVKRGIMGSSMGGNISMTTGLLYSEVFANIGAQGGAGGTRVCHIDSALSVYLNKKVEFPLKQIFGSVGKFDLEFPGRNIILLDNARFFHEKLLTLKIGHVYKEFNSGHHDSNWNESIDDILIQFFGKK
jgi:enterochelin esterase-like enzyme